MICPKCGHENPKGELFCEECDWRMDQKYKKPIDKSQVLVYGTFAAAAFGIAAAISTLLNVGIFGMIFGALGMILGSYTMTLGRMMGIKGKIKTILLILQAIAMATGAIGFVYGMYILFK